MNTAKHEVEKRTESGGELFIEGIFAQAEVKNGNGRYYQKAIMEKFLTIKRCKNEHCKTSNRIFI